VTAYRQIAQRLRLQMPRGKPHIESERPRDRKTNRYQDLGPDGQSTTTIEIPDDALADVPRLIRQGAIEPLPAPAAKAPVKGGDDG